MPELKLTEFISGYRGGNKEHILEKDNARLSVEQLARSVILINANGVNTLVIKKIINPDTSHYQDIYKNG